MKTWETQTGTIIAASITETGISTADADAEGYLLSSGTNRSLYWALSLDGTWLLIMRTNADDVALPDDLDAAADWLETMGDASDNRADRIKAGASRVVAACEIADNLWPSDETAGQIDWFREKAAEVIASLQG